MWPLCSKRIPRGAAAAHVAKCGRRSEFCPHCSEVLRGNAACVKHGARCAAAPSPCPNAGCGKKVVQGGMEAHRAVCTFEVVPCAVAGCDVKLERHAIAAHMASAAGAHIQALSSRMLALTARLNEVEAELGDVKAELRRRPPAAEEAAAAALAPRGAKRAKR